MNIEKLANMDVHSCVQWLVENQNEYKLVKIEDIAKQEQAVNEIRGRLLVLQASINKAVERLDSDSDDSAYDAIECLLGNWDEL